MSAVQSPPATVPTLAELHAKRDAILRLAAARGAHGVRVFGSVARGEARPDSDVDLALHFEPGRGVLDFCGLIADLEDLLGRRVDIVDLAAPPRHARAARSVALIEQEAIPL
jgi:predicted nucleotidyltransferase